MQTLKPGSTILAHELERFVFLQDFSPEEREEFAMIARFWDMPRGFRVALEGERAESFYIVDRGVLAVSMPLDTGTEAVNQRIGPQDISGWSWIIPPYTWDFNLTALEDTRLLTFQATALRQLCEDQPHLGYDLMKKITAVSAARLRDTRRQLYGRRTPRPTRGIEL